ncbi:WD40 repeat-like protein [Trametes sanguinea]|nr:WD40 repeat-like protein [Trametes sanguinea]
MSTVIIPPTNFEQSTETDSSSSQPTEVTALAYIPTSLYLISCCSRGVLRSWVAPTDKAPQASRLGPERHGFLGASSVVSFYTAENSRNLEYHVAFASDAGSFVRLQAHNQHKLPMVKPYPVTLAFTPSVSKLIGGANDGTLMVWDLAEDWAELESKIKARRKREEGCAEDDKRGQDKALEKRKRLRNLEKVDDYRNKPTPSLCQISKHKTAITLITISSNGCLMATCGRDGQCCLWEVDKLPPGHDARRDPVLELELPSVVIAILLSPDGRRLATTSDDYTCRIWDTSTGAEVQRFSPGSSMLIMSLSFSPDGSHVACGSSDGKVYILPVPLPPDGGPESQRVAELTGHGGTVNRVAYSPNGRYIVSGSLDQRVRVWDTSQGMACVGVYEGYVGKCLLISPDGATFAYGSRDGQIMAHCMPDP